MFLLLFLLFLLLLLLLLSLLSILLLLLLLLSLLFLSYFISFLIEKLHSQRYWSWFLHWLRVTTGCLCVKESTEHPLRFAFLSSLHLLYELSLRHRLSSMAKKLNESFCVSLTFQIIVNSKKNSHKIQLLCHSFSHWMQRIKLAAKTVDVDPGSCKRWLLRADHLTLEGRGRGWVISGHQEFFF